MTNVLRATAFGHLQAAEVFEGACFGASTDGIIYDSVITQATTGEANSLLMFV